MSAWAWAWMAWIAVGVVLELVALCNATKGDTLSENVWWVLSIQSWGKFLGWMLTAFLVWLAVHFASRGRFG